MDMTLSVVRYHNAPPRQAMAFTVGENGCRIGRRADNDVVLPDPDRWVSSNHATIEFRNGRFCLIDRSSNGTILNNAPDRVPPGCEIELDDGDELTIGPYDIRVSIVRRQGFASDNLDPFSRREPSVGMSAAFDPFDQQRPVDGPYGQKEFQDGAAGGGDLLHQPVNESKPLDDLPEGDAAPDILDLVGSGVDSEPGIMDPHAVGLAPQPPDVLADPIAGGSGLQYGDLGGFAPDEPRVDPEGQAFGAEGSVSDHTPQENAHFHSPDAIPEDYDLLSGDFGALEEPATNEEPALPPEGLDEGLDLVSPVSSTEPVSPGAVTERLVIPSPGRVAEQEKPMAPSPTRTAAQEELVAPSPEQAVEQEVPLVPSPARVAEREVTLATSPARASEQEERLVPSPARASQQGSPVPGPSEPTGGGEDAVAAFLSGLGYAGETPPPEEVSELMETAGALLREMTEGLISVMRSRSTFKSELRIEMTTIRAVENNPFKFSVNADDALGNLLFRRTQGFLPPLQAVKEAMGDVQTHEMAMLAGLRGTLKALLARFDPEQIERQFRKESVLNNLLPMSKKAKCWDTLAEVYAEISADTSDDFLNLFGDIFTQAYEEQIRQLKESRRGAANS